MLQVEKWLHVVRGPAALWGQLLRTASIQTEPGCFICTRITNAAQIGGYIPDGDDDEGCESRRSGLRFVRLNLTYSPSFQWNPNPDELQLIITLMIFSEGLAVQRYTWFMVILFPVFHHFMLGVIASWLHVHVTHVIAVYASFLFHLWGHITCFSVCFIFL